MKMIPLSSIVLQRDGKTYIPPIGVAFEFEKSEIEDMKRIHGDDVGKHLRSPKDESATESVAPGTAVATKGGKDKTEL